MPAKVKMTYADLDTLPADKQYQLIDGEVFVSPAPTYNHQELVVRLLMVLRTYVAAKNLGRVNISPLDVIFDKENVLQPDVVYISRPRFGIISAQINGAPDLCVEVLSPSTQHLDRGPKLALYAKHGVIEYWLVDPVAQRIEIYRPQESGSKQQRVIGSGEKFVSDLLPGLPLDVAGLFAPLE